MMDTSGPTPIHATQGVLDALHQYAPGNITPAGATTSYDQLISMIEPAFEYSTNMANAKMRVAFCDNTAIKVFDQIGRASGKIELMQSETSFGMTFTSFRTYQGTVNLISHPLLNGLGQEGLAIIMDMPALKLAYLDGRDTKAEGYGEAGKQTGDSGVDAVGGSLTTELAVELINPNACCVIEGLTEGVA